MSGFPGREEVWASGCVVKAEAAVEKEKPLWREFNRLEIALVVAFLMPEPSKTIKNWIKATAERQGNRVRR